MENKYSKSFYFTSSVIPLYDNAKNDGLSVLFDKFVSGTRSSVFGGTFHDKIYSPVSGQDPIRKEIVSGIVAATFFMKGSVAALTTMVEAPFERVKLLLQTQGELIKSGRLSHPYRGITDCLIRTIKNEGVISLWRGNSVNLIRIFPRLLLNAWSSAALGRIVFKSKEERINVNKDKKLFLKNMATDAAVRVFSFACLYELEFAHTRLATDVKFRGQRKFKGLLDLFQRTLRSDGSVGIYRGIGIASVGIILDCCSYRTLMFNAFNNDPSKKQKAPYIPLQWKILVVSMAVHYPFKTVYTRMMMTSGETYKYKSSLDAFARIIKKEGFHSLYKGFGAALVCLIPAYYVRLWYDRLEKRKKSSPFGGISVVIERK